MNFSVAAIILLGGLSQVFSHGTEVRHCLTPEGNLRFFVEHWHGGNFGENIDKNNAGTMSIIKDGGPAQVLRPVGSIQNTPPGNLPGCIDPDVLDATCGEVWNDWIWYDFPATCNVAVMYTLISGNTAILTEGCSNLYPTTIQAQFSDTEPPAIKIDGDTCQGHIVVAQTYDPCDDKGVVTWVSSAKDDCDLNPTLVSSSHNSGDEFPIGSTPVTVEYQDNQNQIATCTFTVVMTTGDGNCALPSASPIAEPSASPIDSPSATPSVLPSASPSAVPSASPSVSPSAAPSVLPSASPSAVPSVSPSAFPSSGPSAVPSASPSAGPSASPSVSPSATPSVSPSEMPSTSPSASPTASQAPSAGPSSSPSTNPSNSPSVSPSASPSAILVDPVNLGKAIEFAILSKSGVTTTPGSDVTGNMGTSPIAVTAITGFGLALHSSGTYSTTTGSSNVHGGHVYGASHAAPTPGDLTIAVGDMGTAFTDAAGRVNPSYVELGAGDINGLTLEPALYKWSTNVGFTNSVTFDGNADSIWILQIAGNLYVGSGAEVFLAGGARAENVFWQVSGLVDVGTTAHLEGIFLVKTMMAFKTGSSLNGAALAQTAVTLQSTKIVKRSTFTDNAGDPRPPGPLPP